MHTEYKALFYHLISWNTENSSLKFAGVWNPHTYPILWPITKRAPHYHNTKYPSRRKPSSSRLSRSHPICLDGFNANISESMSGNVSNWMTTNFVQRALRGKPCWDKMKCLEQSSEICQANVFSVAKVSCIYLPAPTPLFSLFHLSLISSERPGNGWETKTEGPIMSAVGYNQNLFQL